MVPLLCLAAVIYFHFFYFYFVAFGGHSSFVRFVQITARPHTPLCYFRDQCTNLIPTPLRLDVVTKTLQQ